MCNEKEAHGEINKIMRYRVNDVPMSVFSSLYHSISCTLLVFAKMKLDLCLHIALKKSGTDGTLEGKCTQKSTH